MRPQQPPPRTSGSARQRPMAMSEAAKTPSMPTGVIKCCRLGVRRNGTASVTSSCPFAANAVAIRGAVSTQTHSRIPTYMCI